MATAAQWIQGARLRTLPAAIAPVLIGTAAAYEMDSFLLPNAILAALWQRGREKRLAQSGGVMPPLPMRSPSDVRPPAKMPPRPGQGKSSPPGRGRPGQHRGWR